MSDIVEDTPTTGQQFTAEALGTFVLVFFGCGAAVYSGGDLVATALTFGLTVVVMAYAVGRISGGHFNPDDHQHGMENPQGLHAGDLPNIQVPASGELTVEHFAMGLTLDQVLDDDGAAMMVHAGADDYASDPAGDAGDRIACGIIER